MIILACVLFSGLRSQNMASGEYWIDTDPGFGQAGLISLPNSTDVSAQVESIDLNGLGQGTHQVGIRTKDENGTWSHTHFLTVYIDVDDTYLISSAEYFADVDPGYGLATNGAIGTNTDINEAIVNMDIGSVPVGHSFVCFRSRNSNGAWGLTSCRNLLVEQGEPGNVVLLEYFWDVDPGFGNGTSVSMGQGNDVPGYALMADVVPTPGVHYINARILDERGAWSHTIMDSVEVMPVSIEELNRLGFKVYPNPFAEGLFIDPTDEKAYFIDIRDVNGRVVHQQRIQGYTNIHLDALSSGPYYLMVHLPSGDIYATKISKR